MKKAKFLAMVTAGLCAMVPSAVVANTIYLSCTFMVDGKPNIIDFTADEAAGKVSILTRESGFSRTEDAAFTPDKVLVNESRVRWEINRVDLTVTSTLTMIDSANRGQCEIVEAPKRAF